MKHLITALFLIACFGSVRGQYRKLMPFELACDADLVVVAKIKSMDPLRFSGEVTQVVAGEASGGVVSVQRFINTKVAKRWGKYTVGESLLLFLRKDGEHYKIMGEGGEGEKLIMGEEVCIDSRGDGLKNRFGYHSTPSGANIYAEKVPLQDYVGAIQDVRGCAKVAYVEKTTVDQKVEQHPVVTVSCEGPQKDAIYGKSWVHGTMMEQAEKHVKGAQ